MNVWQIATGRSGRDYRDIFFEYDAMIMGPGYLGDALKAHYADGRSTSIQNQIHSFAHNPKPGDRVIMRFTQSIIGVGQVPLGDQDQYSFEESFRTVYGWDLRHCRRVKWAKRGRLGPLARMKFPATQQPTFTRIHDPKIIGIVESLPDSWFRGHLRRMPSPDASAYTEEEFGAELFRSGISGRNIQDIYAALRQADNLCSWYRQDESGERPTEHEVVSHIILPLFLGLGWSPQQLAVEWNKVDVAFFKKTPTREDNCVIVLEAKGMGEALGDVLVQPTEYIRKLHLTRVRYIVVTNGATLFVYAKKGGKWNPTPVAFLDVTCLQRQYLLPKKTDPIRTLVMLQPSEL